MEGDTSSNPKWHLLKHLFNCPRIPNAGTILFGVFFGSPKRWKSWKPCHPGTTFRHLFCWVLYMIYSKVELHENNSSQSESPHASGWSWGMNSWGVGKQSGIITGFEGVKDDYPMVKGALIWAMVGSNFFQGWSYESWVSQATWGSPVQSQLAGSKERNWKRSWRTTKTTTSGRFGTESTLQWNWSMKITYNLCCIHANPFPLLLNPPNNKN